MPRGPRLDMEGALHHVIARELEARDFLLSDTNRQDLAKRMTDIATKTLNCGDVIDPSTICRSYGAGYVE